MHLTKPTADLALKKGYTISRSSTECRLANDWCVQMLLPNSKTKYFNLRKQDNLLLNMCLIVQWMLLFIMLCLPRFCQWQILCHLLSHSVWHAYWHCSWYTCEQSSHQSDTTASSSYGSSNNIVYYKANSLNLYHTCEHTHVNTHTRTRTHTSCTQNSYYMINSLQWFQPSLTWLHTDAQTLIPFWFQSAGQMVSLVGQTALPCCQGVWWHLNICN